MVCIAGVGSGKSAFVSHGLQLHQQNCHRHPELVEMLKDENRPLAIHITFNSDTPFDGKFEKNMDHSLIRRILFAALDIPWLDACELPLSDSLTLNKCLDAIVKYHREVNGFQPDHKVFVYVGVDEINALVNLNISSSSISALKALGIAFRGSSITNGYLSSIFAGTHWSDIKESFLGSGIRPHYLSLTSLTPDVIMSLLKKGGLNDGYLNHPKFRQLVIDTGYMMRAIGILVSHLQHQYQEDSITLAEIKMRAYLDEIVIRPVSEVDTQALLCYVLSGIPVESEDLLWKGSSWTMDKLQKVGMIYLLPCPAGKYQVYISRIIYKSITGNKTKLNDESKLLCIAGDRLLGFIDSYAHDPFEKFAAHFHSFKKYAYLLTHSLHHHLSESSTNLSESSISIN